MDGLVDWYLLGLATGLGVAAGVAVAWLVRRAPVRPLGGLVLAATVAAVVVIAFVAVGWAAVGGAGGLALAFAGIRRLAAQALPAAALVALAIAVVPALGFLEAVLAPVLGARLGRRADTRYAGLRILARD